MNTNQSEAAKKWWGSLSDTDQCKTADNYGNMSLDDIYYYEVRQYEEKKEETPLPETVEEAATKHADELYTRDDDNTLHLWENRKNNFLDGAAWQKEQTEAKVKKLTEALEKIMRKGNATLEIKEIAKEALKV